MNMSLGDINDKHLRYLFDGNPGTIANPPPPRAPPPAIKSRRPPQPPPPPRPQGQGQANVKPKIEFIDLAEEEKPEIIEFKPAQLGFQPVNNVNNVNNISAIRCTSCHNSGHLSRECPFKTGASRRKGGERPRCPSPKCPPSQKLRCPSKRTENGVDNEDKEDRKKIAKMEKDLTIKDQMIEVLLADLKEAKEREKKALLEKEKKEKKKTAETFMTLGKAEKVEQMKMEEPEICVIPPSQDLRQLLDRKKKMREENKTNGQEKEFPIKNFERLIRKRIRPRREVSSNEAFERLTNTSKHQHANTTRDANTPPRVTSSSSCSCGTLRCQKCPKFRLLALEPLILEKEKDKEDDTMFFSFKVEVEGLKAKKGFNHLIKVFSNQGYTCAALGLSPREGLEKLDHKGQARILMKYDGANLKTGKICKGQKVGECQIFQFQQEFKNNPTGKISVWVKPHYLERVRHLSDPHQEAVCLFEIMSKNKDAIRPGDLVFVDLPSPLKAKEGHGEVIGLGNGKRGVHVTVVKTLTGDHLEQIPDCWPSMVKVRLVSRD